MVLRRPTKPSRTTPKKDILFIIGDWNAKVGSQEIPGVTGKFGLGVRNEARQRLTEFCQENTLVIANTLFQQHKRRLYTWTSQMVSTEISLIIFFAAKDGEALYCQQKQDWAPTVAQIVKHLPATRETWVQSWVGKIPWRRKWQPTPVFLPGESPWTEKPGGLQSIGLQRVRHDWAAKYSTFFIVHTK